jgi:hypothetical protein
MPDSVQATVISGTITNWEGDGPAETIGDGVHRVTLYWSINTYDKGWFYRGYDLYDSALSKVAFATGVTDISQISDASIFSFFDTQGIGPYCDADSDPDGTGDFIVWKNMTTGHYGVLRIDDIAVIDIHVPLATLDGTWWFQTDGTGDFSSVPEPSSFLLFFCGQAALGILFKQRVS